MPPVKPCPQKKHSHSCSPPKNSLPLPNTLLFLGLTAFPGAQCPAGGMGESSLAACRGLSLQEAERGAHHSRRHTGKGLPCHRHQPQQHCSHGDRKERTRLDQSRLEQTPPTITIIHNPHLPPSSTASHVYQGRIVGKCSDFKDKNPAAGEGRRSGAGLPQSTRHTRDPITHLTRG